MDTGDATRYDRRVSSRSRRTRLVVIPLVLFVVVVGAVFTLAKLHLARPSVPKAAAGQIQLGDPYNGETVFQANCAGCHGDGGKGGGGGPRLVGDPITLAAVKAQIDGGGSVMPPGIVSGKSERDVLAYLAGIVRR
jgi:mono/diheme cytochrome c family protein